MGCSTVYSIYAFSSCVLILEDAMYMITVVLVGVQYHNAVDAVRHSLHMPHLLISTRNCKKISEKTVATETPA